MSIDEGDLRGRIAIVRASGAVHTLTRRTLPRLFPLPIRPPLVPRLHTGYRFMLKLGHLFGIIRVHYSHYLPSCSAKMAAACPARATISTVSSLHLGQRDV